MPVFPFYKFSPSGNATLLLAGALDELSGAYCRLALSPEGICAEQCGMADLSSKSLRMGGNEFCANASRAFGALLALKNAGNFRGGVMEFDARVSGSPYPVRLTVSGAAPLWRVSAAFPLHNARIRIISEKITLVSLPGITHLLFADAWPDAARIPALAQEAREAYHLTDCPASGVVWWRKDGDSLQIMPHVEVPEAGTSMIESSCGSASLALALVGGRRGQQKEFFIRQPEGSVLFVKLFGGDMASLSGEVRLCAHGELFLPDL